MSARKSSVAPETVPSDPTERRAWINYQLSLRGLSLAELASRNNVARQTVWTAMHRRYPKMEKVIARALRIPVAHLWPERYSKEAA